ncbi:MAG: DUF433 domain-containing protein, partial [Acidobacteria bacterium]|nr:DUF433 domain-containing protein [Acidobacteriota bacterium]
RFRLDQWSPRVPRHLAGFNGGWKASMGDRALKPFKNFLWIVADPQLLGGKLAIRGTRFSVSFILSCLAEGMSVEEIYETYGQFPREAIPELMRIDSQDMVTISQLRGPEFLEQFRSAWVRSPIRPIAGQLLHWPAD